VVIRFSTGAVRFSYAEAMAVSRQKLYAYVDESGQDTAGGFFVVGVLVLGEERVLVRQRLEQIEQHTGKGKVKWHKSRPARREAYVARLNSIHELRGVHLLRDLHRPGSLPETDRLHHRQGGAATGEG